MERIRGTSRTAAPHALDSSGEDLPLRRPNGPASLLDLFEGRRQLIVYRFLYGPDGITYAEGSGSYPERGCVGCSFLADQVAQPAHLKAGDTTVAFVSRAPRPRSRA